MTTAGTRYAIALQRCIRPRSALAALMLTACVGRVAAPLSSGDGRALVVGEFTDDYAGRFSVSDTMWFQRPRNRFRIVEWHENERFLIAQNAADDPTAPNLWTRIDWMTLDSMPPFTWGFCLTAYRAVSREAARQTAAANRAAPRSGCNGFPFTRMQRVIRAGQ
jgi:hypothetical protein